MIILWSEPLLALTSTTLSSACVISQREVIVSPSSLLTSAVTHLRSHVELEDTSRSQAGLLSLMWPSAPRDISEAPSLATRELPLVCQWKGIRFCCQLPCICAIESQTVINSVLRSPQDRDELVTSCHSTPGLYFASLNPKTEGFSLAYLITVKTLCVIYLVAFVTHLGLLCVDRKKH